MKSICMLVGLLWLLPGKGSGLSAQQFSIPEAEAIAEFLYLDNVLSEFGKEELKFRAREGQLRLTTEAHLAGLGEEGQVSAAQILRFLHEGYEAAHLHRQGMDIYIDLLLEAGITSSNALDSLGRIALDAAVRERLQQRPGYHTEQRLALEHARDSLPLREDYGMGWSRHATYLEDRAIPESRSALGYDARATLHSLHTLRLIDDATYDHHLLDLRQNGGLPDHRLLQQLATAANDRDTRNWRTAQRSLALEWLAERQLLAPGSVARFGQDSSFLGATEEYGLYALFRDLVTIPLRTPTDVADLSRQLQTALCAFDTVFCSLSVQVVTLPTAADQLEDTRYRVVGTYRGREISRSGDWPLPGEDRDLLSWVGSYPLDPFMSPYNSLLDSLNAAYRLYYAFPAEHDGLQRRDLLVLPLGSRGARAIAQPIVRRAQGAMAGPDPAGFLSPEEAASWLDSLDTRGFFAPLSGEDRAAGRACVREGVAGPVGFFSCFPTLTEPQREGLFFDTVKSLDPLPELAGDYYFTFPPGVDGGGLYLRLEDAPAAYLSKQLGTGLRKL